MTGYVRNATGTGYDIGVWHLLAGPAGGTGHDFGSALALDGDGKVVVVGHSINASGDDDLVVARYNNDGTLDTTFGGDVDPADGTTDGYFTHHGAAGGNNLDEGKAMVIDQVGRIVIGGQSLNALNNADATIWRLN